MKKLTITLIVIAFLLAAGFGLWWSLTQKDSTPNDGNTQQTQSQTATYKNATNAQITITSPEAGATVTHDVTVTGKAVGGWYFEGSFTLEAVDASGTVIATAQATALSEWTTTDFVNFSGVLHLPSTFTGKASIIAHKSNPSGLAENEASLSLPVVVE